MSESAIKALKDQVVMFAVETDKEGEEYAILDAVLTSGDAEAATRRVKEVADGAIAEKDGSVTTFNDTWHRTYDDYLFVRVVVIESTTAAQVHEFEFSSVEAPVEGEEIDATFFAEDDGIVADSTNKVMWVIEGLEWAD